MKVTTEISDETEAWLRTLKGHATCYAPDSPGHVARLLRDALPIQAGDRVAYRNWTGSLVDVLCVDGDKAWVRWEGTRGTYDLDDLVHVDDGADQ